jgi:hypothetical protein
MKKSCRVTVYIPIDDFILIEDIAKVNKITLGIAIIKLLEQSNKWCEMKDQDKYAKTNRNLKL